MKIDLDGKTKGQLLICGGVILIAIFMFISVYENSLYKGARGGFIIGLGMVFWGFFKIKGNKYSFKCVDCLKVSYRPQIKDEKCPFCGGEIEFLEGFFERHPKLKNGN
jgi:hypothetical protein